MLDTQPPVIKTAYAGRLHNSSTGALYYDPDGGGGATAVQFATLTGAYLRSRLPTSWW
jgi:Ca2+-binding RTX toxin-like protein